MIRSYLYTGIIYVSETLLESQPPRTSQMTDSTLQFRDIPSL